jgi:hypothetical protein
LHHFRDQRVERNLVAPTEFFPTVTQGTFLLKKKPVAGRVCGLLVLLRE